MIIIEEAILEMLQTLNKTVQLINKKVDKLMALRICGPGRP